MSTKTEGVSMLDPVLTEYLLTTASAGRQPLRLGSPQEGRAMLELRAQSAPPGRPIRRVEDVVIPGGDGGIPARVYHDTADPIGTLLFFHGGGWVIGSVNTYDRLMRELAATSRARVISVDYRLAPEHAFPAAHDDARSALAWVATAYPDSPIGVAGDSAGGNLAAYCAAVDRDSGAGRVVLQALAYPVLDSDTTRPSYAETYEVTPLLSGADMEWVWDQYVPDVAERTRAEVTPLRLATHAGLPATFLVIADHDPLRDEGLLYAEALKEAGVPVAVSRHPDMVHGFAGLLGIIPQAQRAIDDIGSWSRARFESSNASSLT
ncbi:alpha/beta hydrolase [Microbacterium sp. NPDC076895]|uniref:alpha/beta hydrolase n=1 Tax=Microbacterium sp. NPDC076895 TaxID=3154957 RepID=UPI003426FCFA